MERGKFKAWYIFRPESKYIGNVDFVSFNQSAAPSQTPNDTSTIEQPSSANAS